MNSFLQMDIFFFITSLVVLVMGTLGAIALYLLVRILRDIRDITSTVKKEAVEIAEDFTEVRSDIKEGVHAAKTYTKAVAGATIVKGVSNLLESFAEEKVESKKRRTRTKKKKTT